MEMEKTTTMTTTPFDVYGNTDRIDKPILETIGPG